MTGSADRSSGGEVDVHVRSKQPSEVRAIGPGRAETQPLRVLLVTVSAGGIGGMQQHTHDLVRGLVEAGHDVEVVCPASSELSNDLYGARWSLLEARGRYDPRWATQVVAAYRDAHSRAALDVIHSESTSAAPLVRQALETPVVVMYHGNYLGLARAHVRRAIGRPRTSPTELRQLARLTWLFFRDRNAWAFRDSEAMVVSRQQLRDTARSILSSPDRFHVVPNGVDISLFRPGDRASARRALGIADGFVLAMVGRLNREKGFDVALEAVARLASDYSGLRLLVVGEGEEQAALGGLARHLGIADRVDFAGPQTSERVAEYLVASDVFLFPTRRDEAFGLVVAEAMACGLPVVASRIGGVPEVLESVETPPVGFLVRPGSVDELEAAVRTLADDPGLRRKLGSLARERAVAEYSVESMVRRTVAVYRAAIARAEQAQ